MSNYERAKILRINIQNVSSWNCDQPVGQSYLEKQMDTLHACESNQVGKQRAVRRVRNKKNAQSFGHADLQCK